MKEYAAENYYHAYNRGVAKQPMFHDEKDYYHFLHILERHLDPNDSTTKSDGTLYRKFNDDIELLSFCLMKNHYHLLFYINKNHDSLHLLMQSVMTAYTMYFNKKYKRVGTLFQGVFKASRITDDSYLIHISRYIHMNPNDYLNYPFSSIACYLRPNNNVLPWLKAERVLALFEGAHYKEFLADYEGQKTMLKELKSELADF